MIFNTWIFAFFGVLALTIYWALIPRRLKPQYLIAAGCVFYMYSVPAYLALIVVLGAITFGIARLLMRPGPSDRVRRGMLAVGVMVIVGVLLYFKYTKLFAITIDQFAGHTIVPLPAIVVPLAISFFSFEFVHVLVDAYHKKITSLTATDFAVFTVFFPTLVAGPIKRLPSFAPQVDAVEPLSRDVTLLNVYRVVVGLAKKYVIADSMTLLTQPILTPNASYAMPDYWVAMLAFSAKIYFDFSGYSDIAIGAAALLGFCIPENFDRPYWSENISQFWRRWHMSLSSWIRDYVFIPLGGSRRGKALTSVNLLMAMAIAGLWHGAAWTFVLWGLWHGVGLAAHRIWSQSVVPRFAALSRRSLCLRSISVLSTFAFVCFGWVLFAATSTANAAAVFGHLLGQ